MGVNCGPKIFPNDLILYYDADNVKSTKGLSTKVLDLTPNSNDGNLLNGVSLSGGPVFGLIFDGTNDYLSIPNSQSIQQTLSTGDYTIIATVKSTSDVYPKTRFPYWQQNYAMNPTWASGNTGISIGEGSSSSDLKFEISDGDTYVQEYLPNTISESTTYHRAITISRVNGITLKYYLNSQYMGEINNTQITNPIYISNGVVFGDMWGWMFAGEMYSFRIYSKTLTQAEVSIDYDAFKSKFS